MSGTPDCGGDAAAYVLGALEPQEVEAFRAHMQQCAVCRDEVDALRGVVQVLPMSAPQYRAPGGLKRRVLREARRERAQAAPARAGLRPPAVAARASGLRPPMLGPRQWLAAAGASLLVAAGVVLGIELSGGAAATVIKAQLSGVSGSAQLRLADGHAELVVRRLTPPGRGHVYEVWLQSGKAAPVPASVLFGVNSSGDADVGIPRRIQGVTAVMVTQEPLGGASRPTHAPVIVARLD